jgi:hypothetical protein
MAGEEPQVRLDVELGDDLALPKLPPVSAIFTMRSNISIGGSGSCALPGPKQVTLGGTRSGLQMCSCASGRSLFHRPAGRPGRSGGTIGTPAAFAQTAESTLPALPGLVCHLTYGLNHVVRHPSPDFAVRLRQAGLRPTRQRVVLARLLFEGGHRHVTAESLHDEVKAARTPVSLATVYNALNQFSRRRPCYARSWWRRDGPISTPIPAITTISSSKTTANCTISPPKR